MEKIFVDDIVAEIAPRGQATVPESIKTELLHRIRTLAPAKEQVVRRRRCMRPALGGVKVSLDETWV